MQMAFTNPNGSFKFDEQYDIDEYDNKFIHMDDSDLNYLPDRIPFGVCAELNIQLGTSINGSNTCEDEKSTWQSESTVMFSLGAVNLGVAKCKET